jgi:sirohydrochlorin ferrochelatase
VVLVPYFLSAGVHVRRDLAAARDRLARAFPHVEFRLAEPLGRHPLLLEVVAERADEACRAASPPQAQNKRVPRRRRQDGVPRDGHRRPGGD